MNDNGDSWKAAFPKPDWEAEDVLLYCGDCLEILPKLPDGCVDAVVTDPPYCGVKEHEWDNQWTTDSEFLLWVNGVCERFASIMTSNGSLYWFASPRMAARVEVEIGKRFRVLNNIVWHKAHRRGGVGGVGIDVTALRRFWTGNSERIVFAEQYGTDQQADDASGYTNQCESIKRSLIGDYLREEFRRAGVTQRNIAELFLSMTGGLTGCVSNWLLGHNVPTLSQYDAMRRHLNGRNGERDYLRREYEDLRREYEDLRRPFNVTAKDVFDDVWSFPIERNQQHPTQKPVRMLAHIVNASSRGRDMIFDAFMGSGTTGVACIQTGRRFVGIELVPDYFEISVKRIEAAIRDDAGCFEFAKAKAPDPQMELNQI